MSLATSKIPNPPLLSPVLLQVKSDPEPIDIEGEVNMEQSKESEQMTRTEQKLSILPVKERYSILSRKYGKDKKLLENRFDVIYKHYRKQMYVPYESFKVNDELLMDLRIFLKYYKEFEIAKKFKTNEAIKHFKKIAQNGLWLTEQNFIQIHYKLVQILDLNQPEVNKLLENEHHDEKNEENNATEQITKYIDILSQNIQKIKALLEVIPSEKIKSVRFNGANNPGSNAVKKIVQVHSGLMRDDVMLKLKERNDERNNRKNLLSSYVLQKINNSSPQKLNRSPSKILDQTTDRSSPHKLSIYKQLDLPNLRSRQLRRSSVYSSLEVLNIQKEKQRLKQLVNEDDKEKYLEAFFKRERQSSDLVRCNSVALVRSNQNTEDSINFSIKSGRSTKPISSPSIFQRNLSLPRMKFT